MSFNSVFVDMQREGTIYCGCVLEPRHTFINSYIHSFIHSFLPSFLPYTNDLIQSRLLNIH